MESYKSINHNISHRIYLVFHASGLSCLITDKHKNPVFFENFQGLTENKLEVILQSRPYFKEIYSSGRLILDLPRYVLFPAENFLAEEDFPTLYGLSHRKGNSELLIELEETSEIKAICSIDSNLYQAFRGIFPGLRVIHHVHYLLGDHSRYHSKGEVLGLYLRKNELTILVKRNESVLLINTYTAENDQEIQYYTMLAAELSGIDALNATLYLWISDFKESTQDWFKPYFNKIEKITPDENLFKGLNEMETQAFRNESILHAALSCES